MADTEQKLWAVEHHLACMPAVKVYTLLKETPHGFTVRIGACGTKFLKREVAGRRYFQEEARMLGYLRNSYHHMLESAQRQIDRLQKILSLTDPRLIRYARNDDIVIDEVG